MRKHKQKFKTLIIGKSTIFKSLIILLAIASSIPTYKYMKNFTFLSPEQLLRLSVCAIEHILPNANTSYTLEKFNFIKLVATKASGFDVFVEKQPQLYSNKEQAVSVSYTSVSEDTLPKPSLPPVETGNIKEKNINSYTSVAIDNKTGYNINVDELLNSPLQIKNTPDSPLVLIVHTHTTESYTPSETYNYTPQANWRTCDENFNMIRVGNKFAEILSSKGVNVIHDKSINDYPSYNGSYSKTLGIINTYLKKYPSIQIVIDIHRDSITAKDGTRYKVSTEIDKKRTAQIMIVMGTDEGGLSHPNWSENLKLGLKLQSKLNSTYNNIARPLSIRKERFNTHATNGSMIIEIGTDANTLDEALLCAEYSANVFADVINSHIKKD